MASYNTMQCQNSSDSEPTIPAAINKYRKERTLAQGLMDVALLSANANQLRYVFEKDASSGTASFYIITSLIIISLILQAFVGALLLKSMQYTLCNAQSREECYRWGSYVTYGTYMITIVNVFIVSFGGSRL